MIFSKKISVWYQSFFIVLFVSCQGFINTMARKVVFVGFDNNGKPVYTFVENNAGSDASSAQRLAVVAGRLPGTPLPFLNPDGTPFRLPPPMLNPDGSLRNPNSETPVQL